MHLLLIMAKIENVRNRQAGEQTNNVGTRRTVFIIVYIM